MILKQNRLQPKPESTNAMQMVSAAQVGRSEEAAKLFKVAAPQEGP